jgi:hypothetical protein
LKTYSGNFNRQFTGDNLVTVLVRGL